MHVVITTNLCSHEYKFYTCMWRKKWPSLGKQSAVMWCSIRAVKFQSQLCGAAGRKRFGRRSLYRDRESAVIKRIFTFMPCGQIAIVIARWPHKYLPVLVTLHRRQKSCNRMMQEEKPPNNHRTKEYCLSSQAESFCFY